MIASQCADPDLRLKEWNSHIETQLKQEPSGVLWLLNGLAALDCNLLQKEIHLIPKLNNPNPNLLSPVERINYYFYSALWVLGAYEVVRTIHHRLRNHPDPTVKNSQLCVRFGKLKKEFGRVRMPLAKCEPQHNSPQDTGAALPGFDPVLGAAWTLASGESVARRHLSDSFLQLLHDWQHL
jgi:hypothetical protein